MTSTKAFNLTQIEKGVQLILRGLQLDPKDENFVDTPERYARFLVEMFQQKEVPYVTFPEVYSDFILFKHHTMHSLCPHHLLPVEFEASVAYVPTTEVLGLSKLVRILNDVNDRPLLQEHFTKEVVARLYHYVPSIKGAACYVDGQHGCTKIRGVRSEGRFVTYHLEGDFKEQVELERRFFDLVLHR